MQLYNLKKGKPSSSPKGQHTSLLARYDNVTLIPLVLHLRLQIGPIQRLGAAPGVIHTGRYFVLILL